MDQGLKQYAETLYENARTESVQKLRADIQEFLGFQAYSGHDSYGRQTIVKINGPDVSNLLRIYDQHIERCMLGRFESYQQAFAEGGRIPSAQELTDVWSEAQEVRILEVRRAGKSLKDFIESRGGSAFAPDEAVVQQNSGQAHERDFQQWKIWKAKAQLKAASPKAAEREKQLDKLMGLFNRAEFDEDLVSLCSKS